jgi:hypothetical protein
MKKDLEFNNFCKLYLNYFRQLYASYVQYKVKSNGASGFRYLFYKNKRHA